MKFGEIQSIIKIRFKQCPFVKDWKKKLKSENEGGWILCCDELSKIIISEEDRRHSVIEGPIRSL